MYHSPIDIIYDSLKGCVEDEVYKCVQSVGIEVNKEELIKALKYDRQMYEKGYKDGIKSKETCEGCRYKDALPYKFPCNVCSRNITDLYSSI